MMRKGLLLTTAFVLMSGNVWAEETAPKIVASGNDCGSNCSWSLDEYGNLNITGSGNMKNFDSNNRPWQDKLTEIKSVHIDNGITSVGNSAFPEATNLENVYIGKDVISIGNSAFSQATNLESVHIAEGSSLSSVGSHAFSYDSNLTSINLPNSLTNISSYAFMRIGVSSIEIPANVVSIGAEAFSGTKNLKTVTFAENSKLKSIGADMFYGSAVAGDVYIPDSVTFVGSEVFLFTGVTSVNFSENSQLESIEKDAFWYMGSLKTIVFPPNFQIEPETELRLAGTNKLENLYLTAEQAENLKIVEKETFTPTIYKINEDGTVSIIGDVEGFLDVENQNLPTRSYNSFSDMVSGKIAEMYVYDGYKKKVYDANKNYLRYCKYKADAKSTCFTPKGRYLGQYDEKGNRIYKKIYTVEEAMEATKDGERFRVYLTYK